MKLEWNPNNTPKAKMGLHIAQIVLAFGAWCLGIAVFLRAKVSGNNIWAFVVFFLSIPGWIYLIMSPRFDRARHLAIPSVMLGVDVFFLVLWLSAFAAQASYNSSGRCGKACGLSKTIVALDVFVTLLFGATAALSYYTLTYNNFHGSLPGYDSRKIRGSGDDSIDPDKAAFSMAPHDEEAYERVHMDDQEATGGYASGGYASGGGSGAGGYGNANPYSAEDDDPSRYGALPPKITTLFDTETEYNSGHAAAAGHAAPVPESYPNPYSDGLAKFPAGDYDRVQR